MNRFERRRKAERSGNRSAIFTVAVVIICIATVIGISVSKLREKDRAYEAREISLQKQYDAELERSAALEEERVRNTTLEHYAQIAREKLGMVFPDEIVVKPNE